MDTIIAAALTCVPAAVGLWLALAARERAATHRRRRRIAGMAIKGGKR